MRTRGYKRGAGLLHLFATDACGRSSIHKVEKYHMPPSLWSSDAAFKTMPRSACASPARRSPGRCLICRYGPLRCLSKTPCLLAQLWRRYKWCLCHRRDAASLPFLTTKSGIQTEFGEAEHRLNFKTPSQRAASAKWETRRQRPYRLIVCWGLWRLFVQKWRRGSRCFYKHHLTSVRVVSLSTTPPRKPAEDSAVMKPPPPSSTQPNDARDLYCKWKYPAEKQQRRSTVFPPFFFSFCHESPSFCVTRKWIGLVSLCRLCAKRIISGGGHLGCSPFRLCVSHIILTILYELWFLTPSVCMCVC